jgi:hypothetical protein
MGWIEDNELRPEVQKLVDRFGQAQTFEILIGAGALGLSGRCQQNFWITVRMGRL